MPTYAFPRPKPRPPKLKPQALKLDWLIRHGHAMAMIHAMVPAALKLQNDAPEHLDAALAALGKLSPESSNKDAQALFTAASRHVLLAMHLLMGKDG